jgi:hypothetical protein
MPLAGAQDSGWLHDGIAFRATAATPRVDGIAAFFPVAERVWRVARVFAEDRVIVAIPRSTRNPEEPHRQSHLDSSCFPWAAARSVAQLWRILRTSDCAFTARLIGVNRPCPARRVEPTRCDHTRQLGVRIFVPDGPFG